jgi:hypothetical protein
MNLKTINLVNKTVTWSIGKITITMPEYKPKGYDLVPDKYLGDILVALGRDTKRKHKHRILTSA